MRYYIEELEDQLIEHLQDDGNFADVNVRTYAGDLSGVVFEDPAMYEGLLQKLPCVFIQYLGKKKLQSDSVKELDIHEPVFRFHIAAQSLRTTKESQRGAYVILRDLYDSIHGHWFNVDNMLYTPALDATEITSTRGMRQLEPITESNGSNEILRVHLPRIVVYSTDYVFQVLA